MSKIKVTESFYALQGEGRYVGTPSVFLRTFGCNLRCKNFGRSKEIIDGPNPEVAEIIKNITIYKTLEELPLVSTGCDTYAAVYPEFKDFSLIWGHITLAEHLLTLTPSGEFNKQVHLVITGGEPFLWQRQLVNLVNELDATNDDPLRITFETNGTQVAKGQGIGEIARMSFTHFSVSPKLSCSGEKLSDAIVPESLASIFDYGPMDFKFVVATMDDLNEVLALRDKELKAFADVPFYLMPVGGLNEMYQLNKTQVADMALKYGFNYSPRLQCEVSGNSWGT